MSATRPLRSTAYVSVNGDATARELDTLLRWSLAPRTRGESTAVKRRNLGLNDACAVGKGGLHKQGGYRPARRHKRASRACSLRASARIEAVVRAGRRCWSQGGDERRRPPNRVLLLSPSSTRRASRGATIPFIPAPPRSALARWRRSSTPPAPAPACALPRIRTPASTTPALAFVISAACVGRSESTYRARREPASRRSGTGAVSGARFSRIAQLGPLASADVPIRLVPM